MSLVVVKVGCFLAGNEFDELAPVFSFLLASRTPLSSTTSINKLSASAVRIIDPSYAYDLDGSHNCSYLSIYVKTIFLEN